MYTALWRVPLRREHPKRGHTLLHGQLRRAEFENEHAAVGLAVRSGATRKRAGGGSGTRAATFIYHESLSKRLSPSSMLSSVAMCGSSWGT